jgi:negative regulator of sigma E activity
MTDSTRGTGAAPGPPWSVDVLADLHAGALDAKQSAALWAQVNRDPEAQAVLAALDSVKRDLDALGDAPVEPMPAHFAAQLDAAIAAEAAKTQPAARPAPAGGARVVDMADARRRRNRRMGWAAGILTAAAAAVAVTFAVVPGDQTSGTPEAAANEPPVSGKPTIGDLQGHKDYGPLDSEDGLKACLSDKGIENPQVMGAREVKLEDTDGVGALLAGGEDGHKFRLVIVDSDCSKIISDTSLG